MYGVFSHMWFGSSGREQLGKRKVYSLFILHSLENTQRLTKNTNNSVIVIVTDVWKSQSVQQVMQLFKQPFTHNSGKIQHSGVNVQWFYEAQTEIRYEIASWTVHDQLMIHLDVWNHICYHKSCGCSACSHTTNEPHLSPTGSKPSKVLFKRSRSGRLVCTRVRLTASTPARTNRTNLENTPGSILTCPKSCFPAWTVFSPLRPSKSNN